MGRIQLFGLVAGLACTAPAPQPSPADDRAELLRLHERQRAAHLNRRADWLVEDWADMAYVIVEKRVHLTTRDSLDGEERERTRFAWMSVYEKQGGRWKLAAIASTERPDSI